MDNYTLSSVFCLLCFFMFCSIIVYRYVQFVSKFALFYANKYLLIAEPDDVMADTIFLKTEQFSVVSGFRLKFLSN